MTQQTATVRPGAAYAWEDAPRFGEELLAAAGRREHCHAFDVRQALLELPSRLLRAAEAGERLADGVVETSVCWVGRDVASHRSVLAALSRLALLGDGRGEPRGPEDIHSHSYLKLWRYLEERGLKPQMKTVHKFGWDEYHIVVRVPQGLCWALGPESRNEHEHKPGLFAEVKAGLEGLCSHVVRQAKDAAGAFSDANTIEFALAAEEQPFDDLVYERLLKTVDVMHDKSYGLTRALTGVGLCAYLGKAGKPVEIPALRACAAILQAASRELSRGSLSSGVWERSVQETCHAAARTLLEDISVREREQQHRRELETTVKKACAEFCSAVAEVLAICRPAEAVKKPYRTGIVTSGTLDDQKLTSLADIARSVQTPRELRERKGLKGGAILKNYYDECYLKAMIDNGELLVAHWSDDPACGGEKLDGFIICQGPDVAMLVVNPGAPPETPLRLIDRMLFEQQGQGYLEGGSGLMGFNSSSFEAISRKLWLPPDIPVHSQRSGIPGEGPLLWFFGVFPIKWELRKVAAEVAANGRPFLKRGFREQARRQVAGD